MFKILLILLVGGCALIVAVACFVLWFRRQMEDKRLELMRKWFGDE
jgi:hypothetical protein